MKLVLFIALLSINVTLSAQDTIPRVKLSELQQSRLLSSQRLIRSSLTTSQKIELRINHLLDSMVRTADASPFFIQKIENGVSNILNEFWRMGILTGSAQEQAFYVKCNAQTMTAKDIAEGRLVVIAGYALIKPAEFEVIRFERILINKTPLQYAVNF